MRDTNEEQAHLCVVGIGASAGGLEAIREMLASADPASNFAYVVIQHLDPTHESLLAELLGRQTALKVRQAVGGEEVERGHVYIIPPGHGLAIERKRLRLTDFAKPRGLRRPIDDFFDSLAVDQGKNAVCVILSGTGGDGSAGLRAIKEHGGLCIAQDPTTARYDGMPHAAQATGLVDFTRPPDTIVDTIVQFHTHKSMMEADEGLARTVADSIDDICEVVRRTLGHDFSGYKRSTLTRRIERRIQVLNLRSADDYLRRLRGDPSECDKLLREFLINVTRFFRDGEHFETLRRSAIAPLVRDALGENVRIWVPGCSSGEEVYSIAMLFAEEVRHQQRSLSIQIFATDIDERMLGQARQGIYPLSALIDIPEEMQDRYTIAREGQFQIIAHIRDMIRFSLHSVVRDPPFSGVDLISCRNLLIYFGERLQSEAIPIFHYALGTGGLLFLGPSETLGRQEDLFETVDQRARLFRRREGRTEYPLQMRSIVSRGQADRSGRPEPSPARLGSQRETAIEQILRRYAPPTLQVSAAGEVLSSTGQLGRYLELEPAIRNARSAQAMARPGLREAMSATIRSAAEGARRVVVRDLTARSEYGQQAFDLVADPLSDGSVLLVFRDRARFEPLADDDIAELEPSDSHVQGLEEELRSTRARLYTTVEELETANEELKSSNEEMMSMNEELQSTNEELATVNDELKSKVDQLSVANADLMNFFVSTALPLVVIDGRMRIRNFTDAILSIYPFRGADRGRPLDEVTSRIEEQAEVLDAVRAVIADGEVRTFQVTEREGERIWKLLVTPYRTREGEIEGATLVFTDITDASKLHDALEDEGARLRLALEVTRLGVWEYDPDSRRISLDDTSVSHLEAGDRQMSLAELVARVPAEEGDDIDAAFAAAPNTGEIAVNLQVRLAQGGWRILQLVGRQASRRPRQRLLGVMFDITTEHEASRLRDLMLREMDHRVKNNFAIIMSILRGVGRNATSVGEVVDGVQSRIGALARSHDMTQSNPSDRRIELSDAIQASLLPYDGQAPVTLGGPAVPLTSKELTPLALILHEWATNAVKYGVLNEVPGRLDLDWRRDDDRIELTWTETYDAPQAARTEPAGFGSTLAEMSALQLGGEIETKIADSYRQIRLRFPPRD